MAGGVCGQCGGGLLLARAGARFCSTRCRVAWHRTQRWATAVGGLPAVLTDRVAWTRAVGKRPVTVSGAPASSTDPATWSTYAAVRGSRAGDGFGVMLGGGLACWDLDHCIDGDVLAPWARALLTSLGAAVVWLELSVSGTGVHAFVEAPEGPGHRDGWVEFYSRARFIRVTGDRFEL